MSQIHMKPNLVGFTYLKINIQKKEGIERGGAKTFL